ncbi:MAG: HAD-IIIA family hydrolase [Nanoarchaeota archaeon]|nr:HAD-IIIA family hydrolase [Nanoarchaeota archaeon]
MKAIILAGGKGTRLGNLAKEIPKPMVKIGSIPLLEHQINLLKRYGIKDIIILTNYLSDIIENYFKDGKAWNVNITYFKEEKPLGTTGGIKEIEDKLTGDFLVLYGDVMLDVNLKKLIGFHKNKGSTCTLVLHPNDHPYDSDLVEIDKNQRIITFHPKPHKENIYYKNLVSAALYVMSIGILKHIKKGVKADFGKDIFPEIIRKEKLYGYNTAEYLKDAGTPERLEAVKKAYSTGKIRRFNSENKRRAIFMDRDGVINEEIDLLHKIEDFRFLPNVCKAIKKINESGFLAIMVTNQSVVARNLCSIEQLEEIHKKMETLLGKENAKFDAIYYCPHHPDKGYPEENPKYKIECDCRKPKIGMVKLAEKEFNIDLKNSFFIGDSFLDILCGKNAGMTTVGVKTGFGCKDTKVKPDYFFEDLNESINFIIQEPYRNYFKKINNLFLKSKNKKPFIISIGGNTRSGKTIFSNYLSQKFKELNKKVLIINLDNWLLSKELRKKEHNVYGRFQINKINKDLSDFFNRKEIVLNEYNPLYRQITENKTNYKLNDKDIIILEGVVALSSKELRNMTDLKIFCEIDDELLKKRVLHFYSWKGLNKEEIETLIKNRREDEFDLIKKDKNHADLIIGSFL